MLVLEVMKKAMSLVVLDDIPGAVGKIWKLERQHLVDGGWRKEGQTQGSAEEDPKEEGYMLMPRSSLFSLVFLSFGDFFFMIDEIRNGRWQVP